MANKHNAGVPGFVAKPGGGGRPVPARHVASLTSEANNVIGGLQKGHRSLLWAPAAFLSTVIEAFRKVPFFILRKKNRHFFQCCQLLRKLSFCWRLLSWLYWKTWLLRIWLNLFVQTWGSLIRNTQTQF